MLPLTRLFVQSSTVQSTNHPPVAARLIIAEAAAAAHVVVVVGRAVAGLHRAVAPAPEI